MYIHINAISEEDFAALVELVRANHAETTAALAALGAQMATLTQTLNEIASRLGPLATSILDIIAERDAAEAARVEAVNALARERGEEAAEDAEQSAAAEALREKFDDVAGLFDDKKLPDVEPLPPVEPTPAPPADEEPAPVEPTPEPLPVEPDAPAEPEPTPDVPAEPEAPADEPVPAPEAPADESPVEPSPEVPAEPETPADEQPAAPADEPVDDGSGAVDPAVDGGDAPEVPASDVPDSEAGAADSGEVAPNPGAAAEEQN